MTNGNKVQEINLPKVGQHTKKNNGSQGRSKGGNDIIILYNIEQIFITNVQVFFPPGEKISLSGISNYIDIQYFFDHKNFEAFPKGKI